MRPLKLTMTAFGPYRDSETIDFTLLEDRQLFVISGNTGAGKTTVFDAICFALYGSASGEDRSEPRMLRSHFADEEQHTAVDFAFSVGKRKYRVFRQMGHRKGANKSETGAKAELYEIADGRENPAVDRFIVSDVNAKIEAVIGLTKEQFSQIVMLPQGEFRKLLTSDTENKEDVLRRIFRTTLYQKLEERFQHKQRELKDAVKEAHAKLELYVSQVRETLPQREDSALQITLRQEFHSASQVTEGLMQEIEHYRRIAEETAVKKAVLAQQRDQIEIQLRMAMLLNERFAELGQKRLSLQAMDEQKAEIADMERKVLLAERAARIEPYEELAIRATDELKKKRDLDEKQKLVLAAAENALAQAEERHRELECREPERLQSDRRLQKLIELVPSVRMLADRQSELEHLLKEEQKVLEHLAALERQFTALRESRQNQAERIRLMEEEISALPDKLERLERVRQHYMSMKKLADYEQQIAGLAALQENREQNLLRIRAEHDRLERLWLEGQAGMLAAQLHDGQACPVCGSTEHPHKAADAGEAPSREELQKAKEALRHVEQELGEALAQTAAARLGRDDIENELAEYGTQPDKDAKAHCVKLEAEGKRLRAETDVLKKKSTMLEQLRKEMQQIDTQLEKLQQGKEQLFGKKQALVVERSTKQSLLERELEQIPKALRSLSELEAQVKEQQAIAERLAGAWKEAQELLQLARTRVAEERANQMQIGGQLHEAQTTLQQAETRYLAELKKADFATAEDYNAAKMAEETRETIADQVTAFKATWAALERQTAELERELAGKSRINDAEIRERMENLQLELERTASDLQTAERHAQDAERLKHAIQSADEKAAEIETRLEQVLDLYQMLKGDNPQKISFERYILIEFLEQILFAANARLHDLSNGQFVLQRSDRLETRGKQSGLGLDVYDAYTGQNRDVKTLSGGEKFNASLCLALGMTDVIQAHQGGVSIEMMLIDEGFGSLDEESLQKAIAALVDLQRAGRMIGVISHVQELKMAFPAVLEVRKTKEGHSRTEIVLK